MGVFTSWGGNCLTMGNLDDAQRVYREALALATVANEFAPAAHTVECRAQVSVLEGILGQLDGLQKETHRGAAARPSS